MNPFEIYTPTRVVFGPGAEEQAGRMAASFGAKCVLIHYGSERAKKSGLVDRIADSIRKEGIRTAELGGAVPNPRLSLVRRGIELAKREGADMIIGVGGGSAIDSAKAMAYALAEPDRDVWELFSRVRRAKGILPFGAVVTMAAAGSEMSDSCVITNDTTREKRGYNDDLGRPKFALMNPELTVTVPVRQTMAGCADIMMHTLERYFTAGGNLEITDAVAEGLLKTVMRNAMILKKDPANLAARAEIMWAGSLSHNGLTGCGNGGNDFSCHALGHELGARFDATHGETLTAVWASWARYALPCCPERFAHFAAAVMGIENTGDARETGLKGIAAMEDFFRSIGMPVSLKELGVDADEALIASLAQACAAHNGGRKGTARVLLEADMAAIYRAAKE